MKMDLGQTQLSIDMEKNILIKILNQVNKMWTTTTTIGEVEVNYILT